MNKVEENPESEDIPGWSGFQELCGEPSFPVQVGYLPLTRAPITKMPVICTVVNCSLDIMNELGNKFTFMEIYVTIYHKVLDAMFRMEKEGLQYSIKSSLKWLGFVSSSACLERYTVVSNMLG